MFFSQSISNLFSSYTNTQTDGISANLEEILAQLSTVDHLTKFVSTITQDEKTMMAGIFARIGRFFQIKFPILQIVRENQAFNQTTILTTFAEMFNQIKSMNVHQNVDSTNIDVAYPRVVKQPLCACAFHQEELFDHLHVCALIAGIHTMRENFDEKTIFAVTLTGLFHDVGKPECIRIFDKGNIGYPFHGEYGAIILSRLYSSEFAEYISKDDWEIMCRCISIHMCSYHITDFQSNWAKDRVNSTRAELTVVRSRLMSLSYGDVFAAFHTMDDSHKNFVKSRTEYFDMISQPYQNEKSKFLFVVRGRSGSGKTFISESLSKFVTDLKLTVNHIQRDMIISNLVRSMKSLPEITYRPCAQEYGSYYEFYRENKLGAKVNEIFQNQIKSSISNFDVTIIDTQLTMFRGVEQIIPDNIGNCTVISFDVSRNMELIDDSKNGLNFNSQLQMFGQSSIMAPLEMSCVNIFGMSSAFTYNAKPIGFTSDFVFAIGYNSAFNGENSIGLAYFKSFFTEFMKNVVPDLDLINLDSDTDNMNLIEYINHLYQANAESFDATCEILRQRAYRVNTPHFLRNTPFDKKVMSIKYLDHNNNWCVWARETRGTTLVLIDGKWVWLKFLMQRGAEMLTGMQVKRGIDKTDNVDVKLDFKASHLSKDQQELIQDLRIGNDIDLVLSFKKDGSLLSCCLYTGDMATLMREIIMQSCDEFTRTVMLEYDAANSTSTNSTSDTVFVFQSQVTLVLGDAMYDYTTTALFPEADCTLSPIKKIKNHGTEFFKRLNKMFQSIPGTIKHVLGETICANRCESYSGIIHRELAVSYPLSSFTILSITSITGDSYEVKPHYLYSDLISQCGFIEPAFWTVKSVAEVDALIQDVDKCIFNKMVCDEFYSAHPLSNLYSYDKIIDYEGFVTYDLKRGNSYGKIKTDSYYKAHKLRDDNIPFLCELNQVAGHIFPLARIVAETISQLDSKCDAINVELNKLISSDELIGHLPSKASNGLKQRPKAVQFKICINNAKDAYARLGFEIFKSYFPSLVLSDDMKGFIVNYSMNCELWLDSPKKISDELRSFIVAQLISMSN